MCEATREVAQVLISVIDKKGESSRNLKWFKAYEEDLRSLFRIAYECYDLCYNPDMYDLNDGYGNGIIDSIGTDFDAIADKSKYKHFGYPQFNSFHLLHEPKDC